MKLVCLHTWGGILKYELHDFITKQAADTDIVCFQVMFDNAVGPRLKLLGSIDVNLYTTIRKLLLDSTGHYALQDQDGTTLGRNLQYVRFTDEHQAYTIINFHGLWNSAGKTDRPSRLKQSQNIKRFIETETTGKVVLVGNFNLNPDTQSLAILEQGRRNLIKEYGISSTRSHYYDKPSRFADYALVSSEMQVTRFEVLEDQVSDHLPLLL